MHRGEAYRIPASVNSGADIIVICKGKYTENYFTDIGVYQVTLTAEETPLYTAPNSVTITLEIMPDTLNAVGGWVYREEGFRVGSQLSLTDQEADASAKRHLSRSEKIVSSRKVNINGDDSLALVTLHIKAPENLLGQGKIKILVTENGSTRALMLSPDADGYITLNVTPSAAVSFVGAADRSASQFPTVFAVILAALILLVIIAVIGISRRRRV